MLSLQILAQTGFISSFKPMPSGGDKGSSSRKGKSDPSVSVFDGPTIASLVSAVSRAKYRLSVSRRNPVHGKVSVKWHKHDCYPALRP